MPNTSHPTTSDQPIESQGVLDNADNAERHPENSIRRVCQLLQREIAFLFGKQERTPSELLSNPRWILKRFAEIKIAAEDEYFPGNTFQRGNFRISIHPEGGNYKIVVNYGTGRNFALKELYFTPDGTLTKVVSLDWDGNNTGDDHMKKGYNEVFVAVRKAWKRAEMLGRLNKSEIPSARYPSQSPQTNI